MNSERGQSLLELVIALGLLSIVVTVLTVAMVTGLKNSQFSKSQVQANKLAQEGLEKVRTIRERNYSVCGGPVGITDWSLLYGTAVSCNSDGDCIYILQTLSQSAPSGCTSTEYWLNNVVTATQSEKITLDGITYERLVRIKDYQTSQIQKEVTVIVSWKDISGDHSSKLVTVFAKN